MSLKKLIYDKTWTSSEDFPTYEDSEQQVRADLQYHPDAIRDYLNQTVAPAMDHLEEEQRQTDQTLSEHGEAIIDLAAGRPPEAVRAIRVNFAAGDWAKDSAEATLHIAQSDHKRQNNNFGYRLWETVSGGSRSGTWNTVGTDVGWDAETSSVVLQAEAAYAGSIVFYGV